MKKRFIILLIVLSISIVFVGYKTSSQLIGSTAITGQTVPGEATSQTAALTITISGSPSLSLKKPENKTYFTAMNLDLEFEAGGANSVWYNIDNGGNITITGNTTFNTTNGQHTLFLFANNSAETAARNVTFGVNITKFIVYYNNYSSSTKGSSTDFNVSAYEDLQNLSGIIQENTNFGKIAFNTAINVTNDSNPSDNILDLDSYIIISNNSIEINSTALPNFNKSATLYFYNLNFTNPRVLRDGSPCSSSICTKINYSFGNFLFNVTHFTTYSAEETPEETPTTTSSDGGGGSTGSVSSTQTFTLDRSQISVSLNPGQVKTEEIIITNSGNQAITVSIDNFFKDFVVRGEDVIILNSGESRAIPLHIIAKVDTIPDLYIGKIVISSGGIKKEILISVEVESAGILLDIRAEILKGYEKVLPGEEVFSEMRLFNLGGIKERKDVLIEYIIKDYENNEIAKETESLAIETQATFVKRINIPKNTMPGNYVLYVRAIYNGEVASASDNFEIVSSKVTKKEKIYIMTIIILAVILSLIIYYTILHARTHKEKRGYLKRVGEKVDLRSLLKK